jgi:hypothetical protein
MIRGAWDLSEYTQIYNLPDRYISLGFTNGGVAKFSTSAFKGAYPVLVLFLCSQPLLEVVTLAPATRPVLSSSTTERYINGRCPLSPLTDGSYLDIGRFPTLMARISTPAINATASSTALPPLYKHTLLAGNGAQTLDLDRAPHRTQT